MPRSKPKALTSYPADWVVAVKNAMQEQGKSFTVARGNGQASYVNTRVKLTAMRNGIKLYELKDSPLQRAAMTERLVFNKTAPIGDYDWQIVVTFLGLHLRPSEEAAELTARWLENYGSSHG